MKFTKETNYQPKEPVAYFSEDGTGLLTFNPSNQYSWLVMCGDNSVGYINWVDKSHLTPIYPGDKVTIEF